MQIKTETEKIVRENNRRRKLAELKREKAEKQRKLDFDNRTLQHYDNTEKLA